MAVLLVILVVVIIWLIARYRRSYGLSSSDEIAGMQRELFKKYSLISILLGASYFLMQAYSFQILNLNLDSPTKSISLLLFLFLLGNGFGSLLTSVIKKDYLRFISIAVFAVIIASLIEYFILLPALRENSKLFWLIASIGIPAFLLGIPFPLLLKLTAKINSSNGIALLLGLSSIGGAAASSLAIIMALIYGFKSVIILALLIYAVILYLIQRTKKQYFLQEV
jgi:predicted MFS family arabinose efflux permease